MTKRMTDEQAEALAERIANETGGEIDQIGREWAIGKGGAAISPSESGRSAAGTCQNPDHDRIAIRIANAAKWLTKHADHAE